MTGNTGGSKRKKSSGKRRTCMVCAVLIIAVFAVYGQAWRFLFINYDDDMYVTENYHVNSGLTVEGIAWAFSSGHAFNWHPLTWLSHMLDVTVYGMNPGGHHMTSILLHVANTVIIFWLFRLMTGAFWGSACIAAFFALHPLHVESVAWISERKDVLSTFFWFLTVAAYVLYSKRPGFGRYIPVLVLFSFSLMAKPMVVTLPFVLLLLDYWPLGRIPFGKSPIDSRVKTTWTLHHGKWKLKAAKLVLEKVPLFVLSAIVSVVTFFVQKEGDTVQRLDTIPFFLRIQNALESYMLYIAKTLLPINLSVFYPFPRQYLPVWRSFGAALFLLVITGLAIRYARRYPFMIVGWLWFVGMLVPVIGLYQFGDQAMADRYTYIPIIGLFIIAAWGLPKQAEKWRFGKIVLPAFVGLLLALSSMTAWIQVRTWRNSGELFSHALEVTNDNYLAHNNLGAYLIDLERYDEAIGHFREAIRIMPDYVDAYNNLGGALLIIGDNSEAEKYCKKAVELKPGYAEAHFNLGIILARTGRPEEAFTHYREALLLKPDFPEVYFNCGNMFARLGYLNEAEKYYKEALRLKPDYTDAQNNLTRVLSLQ